MTVACATALGLSSFVSRADTPEGKPAATGAAAGLSRADVQALSDRFAKELWPVMQANCVGCHGQKNPSQLLLPKDPRTAFLKLLAEGFFDDENNSSLVHRISTTDEKILMPPTGMGPLKRADITRFEKFGEDVAAKRAKAKGPKPDEVFPAHLEMPYTGKRPAAGLDNTFVTFRQLRGKIRAIFGDDWRRDDRAFFLENVTLFGGADFNKRFDETSKATPTFFTGMDMMGRDVASRAYLTKTGPFAGLPDTLPSPLTLKAPTPAYRAAIGRLFDRMLFRDPTAQEMQRAFALLQSVYRAEGKLAETIPQDLRFALTVKGETGLSVTQGVTLRVSADGHALSQEFIDQSQDAATDKEKKTTRWLYDTFAFVPADAGQRVVITNENTHGNVSVAGVTLRGPLPATTERFIKVDDASVQSEGAWNISGGDGFVSYEDNNENKGSSRITFPLAVEKPGTYEVGVTWRRFSPPDQSQSKKGRRRRRPIDNADRVLVEVSSRNKTSALAIPPAPPVPPKGEARFFVDETIDTLPFIDLKTAFRFGEGDGIELRNEGTRRRVVADAVRLLPPAAPTDGRDETKDSIVLKAADAAGADTWVKFAGDTFGSYNVIGPDLFQDFDGDKGKREDLTLAFQPTKARKEGFDATRFYRVGVVFPAKVDNETRVPVVVKARASSPIVQVVAPYHANVGNAITIDASSTFNLQHSKLSFRWEQIGGPRVALTDPTAPDLKFTAPKITARQAAWEGLCRALMEHPDFLFTRPRSLATVADAKTRRRLQLVKIAQDLLARTPTPDEVARVDAGTPLSAIVDQYLKSLEFRDFYFHRTRLYVESHGTLEQDEPARLWTYIAVNDRPFKEILTADYTVDPSFKRQPRPAYYGKTGVLTMKGFIEGKQGLPHFNYPAQVCEKFLGYVFEVPDSIVKMREGITASATTDPNSVCYSCHRVLTPLAYQRTFWDDAGNYRTHDATGLAIDDSDQNLVASYPFKGAGMEAFATQAQNKERFIRTILQTHFVWYFGRELRYDTDERILYKRLWDVAEKNNFAIRPLIRAIVLSPEYLNGTVQSAAPAPSRDVRIARLTRFHEKNVIGFGARKTP
jgi:hypothetical protein